MIADSHIVLLINEEATGDAVREQLRELVERVRSLPRGAPQAQVVFHFIRLNKLMTPAL